MSNPRLFLYGDSGPELICGDYIKNLFDFDLQRFGDEIHIAGDIVISGEKIVEAMKRGEQMKQYRIIECENRVSPEPGSGLYFYCNKGERYPAIRVLGEAYVNKEQASKAAYRLAKKKVAEYQKLNEDDGDVKENHCFTAAYSGIDAYVGIMKTYELDGEILPLEEIDWCCVYSVQEFDI